MSRSDLENAYNQFRNSVTQLNNTGFPGTPPDTYFRILSRYPEGSCPPPPRTERVPDPNVTTTGTTTTTTTTVPVPPRMVVQLCGGDLATYRAIFGNNRQAPTDLKNFCDKYVQALDNFYNACVNWRLYNSSVRSFVLYGAARDNKTKDHGATYRTGDDEKKYTAKPSFGGQIDFLSGTTLFKKGSTSLFAKTAEEMKANFIKVARDNKESYSALLQRNGDTSHNAEVAAARKRSEAKHVRTIAQNFIAASRYLPN